MSEIEIYNKIIEACGAAEPQEVLFALDFVRRKFDNVVNEKYRAASMLAQAQCANSTGYQGSGRIGGGYDVSSQHEAAVKIVRQIVREEMAKPVDTETKEAA